MTIAWNLTQLASEVRSLSAMKSTVQISDSLLQDRINDFLVNHLPLEVPLPQFRGDYYKTVQATEDGDYALESTVLALKGPFQINGVEIKFWQDAESFWNLYPVVTNDVTGLMTDPTLEIGTDPTKVAYGDFYYRIAGHSYYGVPSEVALAGDNVPQGKFGAWRLEVALGAGVSCTQASDNATGYLTAALAIQGFPLLSSSLVAIGFVTVKNSSGVFIPGTTSLSAAGVTVTFTAWDPAERERPLDVLLAGGYLYLRPKPNDAYLFTATKIVKGTGLSGADELPVAAWGPVVAYGTAIMLLNLNGQFDRALDLTATYEYLKGNLLTPSTIQLGHRPPCIRRF